ncbi:hypothetical protein XELAEV_18039440mg [Xenopus laevis]|uniref:Uncharacterized protein n=1 Tax=Xenopus laevis TaxID=8355 RepID=A0A974C7L6_XENLA|nr:hypothetical protein XELAEV_18039440mg [Xenopus laevis]
MNKGSKRLSIFTDRVSYCIRNPLVTYGSCHREASHNSGPFKNKGSVKKTLSLVGEMVASASLLLTKLWSYRHFLLIQENGMLVSMEKCSDSQPTEFSI